MVIIGKWIFWNTSIYIWFTMVNISTIYKELFERKSPANEANFEMRSIQFDQFPINTHTIFNIGAAVV